MTNKHRSVIAKVIKASLLGLLLLLCGCDQHRVQKADQCLGTWKMLDDASGTKSIVLMDDGRAVFNSMTVEDIGGDEGWAVPATGTWELVSDGEIVLFWLRINGGNYGQGGRLKKRKDGLELWFQVGDPDDYAWKRFRLVEPNH